jgi:23S rRNA (pseudouridine1915-N3)-methyltransferase
VIAVGAPKTAGLAAAIRDYESRISHYFKYEATEIRAQPLRAGSEMQSVEKESADLLARVSKGLEIIAYLEKLGVEGKPGVAFLVGGPLGMSEQLRTSAHRVLSLTPLTLPHELARLVLVEQIYRAGTIIRGEPYHKGA